MNYAYDSWNRMLSMNYPDGEEVNYTYDVGGNLRSVTGTSGWQTHRYVDNISYDKFGNRTRIEYGNRVFTNYSYDLLQRLSTMDTYDPTASAYLQQLTYTYDGVGNITGLVNASGQVYEMGGKYDNEYRYDGLYRLTQYNNEWSESPQLNSWLSVGYSRGGRIAHKDNSYMRSSFENETPILQYKDYYSDLNTPNRLTGLYDYNTGAEYTFNWDVNGNMTGYNRNGIETVHYWDEDHRMLASGDALHSSFYFYNGEGERTYKLSGMTRAMNINGQPQTYEILDRATLYVSPYLVASERGASKHIYAGAERIASHPVNSAINGLNSDELSDEELMAKLNAQAEMMYDIYSDYLPGEGSYMNMTWDMLAHLRSTSRNMPKDEIYYYHTDHLGSSSWITYTDGSPVQYMSYMPFGESQIDQRSMDWNSRYTFSGKERDEETGYSYFGARYYDAELSIWLSRDPLADKYPTLSPYVYCANNPVQFVDPNGAKIVFAKGTSKEFKAQFKEAIQHLNNNQMGGAAARLEKSKIVYTVTEGRSGYENSFNTGTKTITWSPSDGLLNPETGVVTSPTTGLNHEFGHADNYDKAMQTPEATKQFFEDVKSDPSNPYGSKEEQRVITGIEQKTAKALGEIKDGEVTRTNHGGVPVPTENVTSNKIKGVEVTAPSPKPVPKNE